MKLTARDQDQQNSLAHAFHDRERFTLTGAGLQAEFVAETLNNVPCVFGSGRYETNLELVQVTEAITQAAWNGEGLPPVGTVCEVREVKMIPVNAFEDWSKCTIIAHNTGSSGDPQVCTTDDRGDFAIFYPATDGTEFRQIRTPEQIAADQREREFEEIRMIIGRNSDIRDAAEELLSLGYRKQ